MVIQYFKIGLAVESTWICYQGCRAITRETPAQHNSTFTELHSWQIKFWQLMFFRQTLNPHPVIQTVKGKPSLNIPENLFLLCQVSDIAVL